MTTREKVNRLLCRLSAAKLAANSGTLGSREVHRHVQSRGVACELREARN